ncbi:MAG: tetratricopeptide repeat protein [Candidatus Riflebacteria bacterium]|nr:tetratricopeptide repeat protein [Candidatus Riflebacteria bacterium]
MKFILVPISTLLLLIAILALPLECKASSGAVVLMEEAVKNRSRGAQANSFKLLRQAISEAQRQDQKTLARLMLGDFLQEAGHLDEARDIYEEVIASSAEGEAMAEAHFRLAQIFQRTGLFEKSRTMANELLNKFPATEYAQLARMLLKTIDHSTLSTDNATKPITAQSSSATPKIEKSDKLREASFLRPIKNSPMKPFSGKEEKKISEIPEIPTTAVSSQETSSPTVEETSMISANAFPEDNSNSNSCIDKVRKVEDKLASPSLPDTTTTSSVKTNTTNDITKGATKKSAGSFRVVDFSELKDLKDSTNKSIEAPANLTPGDLLVYKPISQAEQEEMASSILVDQNILKEHPDAFGNDDVLFRLAVSTARFGEHLEACKLFDKLLSSYPSSPRVEDAYLESVRLRAILKAFPAVMKWGATFLKTFPTSKRRPDVERLIEYARTQTRKGAKKDAPASSMSFHDADSELLRADPRYIKARERLDAHRYALAMTDLKTLSIDHPKAPLVWYDLALVQMQGHAFKDAERSLNTLFVLQPENAEARSLMGYIHFQSKQYDQAAADYDRAGTTKKSGLTFFDPEFAARRMEKTARRPQSGTNP